MKGFNKGRDKWKGCVGPGMGQGHGASTLSRCTTLPNLHQPGSCPNTLLLGFYEGFIAYAWLIKSLAAGNRFNLLPFSHSLRSGGCDWKFQPSQHMIDSPGNQPLPWRLPRSHHSRNKRHCYHSQYLGNSKDLGSCEPGTVDKTKYTWKMYFGWLNDQMHISYESQYHIADKASKTL